MKNFTTTFNPGPSQISAETKADICAAVEDGLLEISHRSSQFSAISQQAINGLRALLHIPSDYRIFYLDSASQAWHSIICNVVAKNSFHYVNGAFSEKFYQAATLLHKNAKQSLVEWGQQNDFCNTEIEGEIELVTLCANETSTGVSFSKNELQQFRKKHQKPLLSVDITSCAGAVDLPIDQADLWYFSVQKVFGLPAGLGILIVSPRAYERSLALAQQHQNLAGIWQWSVLAKAMQEKNYQTPHTPNVLNIHLLAQQCARWNAQGGLARMVAQTKTKMELLSTWVEAHPDLDFYVSNPVHRSTTVLTVRAAPNVVSECKARAQAAGFVLGSGYGKTKADVFRVANFPAISTSEIETLIKTLS